MQNSWVRCHPEIGCEKDHYSVRILCFSKKRNDAREGAGEKNSGGRGERGQILRF